MQVNRRKFGGIGFHDKPGDLSGSLRLPCGKCLGCKLDKASAWAIRCQHEASLWDHNAFITLTYENNPVSLEYTDVQLFLKRLRKSLCGDLPSPSGNRPLRFFCAGEYGEQFDRPHYHILLFNGDFPDKKPIGKKLFQSELLDKAWKLGHASTGSVTPASAAYVSQYAMKKVYGREGAERHYKGKKAEFIVMSRRPGIGAWWYENYQADVLPNDYVVVQGTRRKVPRYYLEKYRNQSEDSYGNILEQREAKSLEMDPADRERTRLHCREEILRSTLALNNTRSL
jgi:hypothetical protein